MSRRPRPSRAFTLVEMLVVLVVLAIAASFALANLRTDPREVLQREAIKLAGALEHATAAAQWRSVTLGISAEERMYRFWRREESGEWQVITQDDLLRPRAMQPGVTVRVERYAGASVDRESIVPLRPSGRNEPYDIALIAGDWHALVRADPLNRVSWAVVQHAAPRT